MENDSILDVENEGQQGHVEVESIDGQKFLLLFFFSLGLYGTWWMYKVWRHYKEKDRSDIMPVARALFAIFFLYNLFDRLKADANAKETRIEYLSGGLFVLYILSNLLNRMPDPYSLLYLFGGFCFILPLQAYNIYLEEDEDYTLVINAGFNTNQTAILVIGGLLWILLVIGLMSPA